MQFEQLQKDMIAAMKARDKVRKDAISALVSAAKKVAIDEGCRDNISEEIVDRVILKEIKSVKEQIDTCPAERRKRDQSGSCKTLSVSTIQKGAAIIWRSEYVLQSFLYSF